MRCGSREADGEGRGGGARSCAGAVAWRGCFPAGWWHESQRFGGCGRSAILDVRLAVLRASPHPIGGTGRGQTKDSTRAAGVSFGWFAFPSKAGMGYPCWRRGGEDRCAQGCCKILRHRHRRGCSRQRQQGRVCASARRGGRRSAMRGAPFAALRPAKAAIDRPRRLSAGRRFAAALMDAERVRGAFFLERDGAAEICGAQQLAVADGAAEHVCQHVAWRTSRGMRIRHKRGLVTGRNKRVGHTLARATHDESDPACGGGRAAVGEKVPSPRVCPGQRAADEVGPTAYAETKFGAHGVGARAHGPPPGSRYVGGRADPARECASTAEVVGLVRATTCGAKQLFPCPVPW